MSKYKNREDALRRVKGLLSRTSERNASEAEANNAAALAQRLMLRHEITANEALSYGEVQEEDVVEQVAHIFGKKKIVNWKTALMRGIAANGFCKYYLSYDYDQNYKQYRCIKLVGKPTNIEACIQMFDYLSGVCDRLSKKAIDNYRAEFRIDKGAKVYDYYTGEEKRQTCHSYADSFRKGFSEKIEYRLNAETVKAMREGLSVEVEQNEDNTINVQEEMTALMVCNAYESAQNALDNYYSTSGLGKKLRNLVTSSASRNWDGASHGRKAAEGVSLNRQIGGSKRLMLTGS